MRTIIHTFALAAVAPCGAVFTHGAPAAQIDSIDELDDVDLSGAGLSSPLEVLDTPVLGRILWARSATETEARRFLRAMGGTLSIYGHDVIPEGFETVGDEQIVVSTSFGLSDANKVYVKLDLAGGTAASAISTSAREPAAVLARNWRLGRGSAAADDLGRTARGGRAAPAPAPVPRWPCQIGRP